MEKEIKIMLLRKMAYEKKHNVKNFSKEQINWLSVYSLVDYLLKSATNEEIKCYVNNNK